MSRVVVRRGGNVCGFNRASATHAAQWGRHAKDARWIRHQRRVAVRGHC